MVEVIGRGGVSISIPVVRGSWVTGCRIEGFHRTLKNFAKVFFNHFNNPVLVSDKYTIL